MNGIVEGDLTLNAAIYQREVCEVCLNCEQPRCVSAIYGCEAFRAALKAKTRKYNRGGGRRAAKDDGKDPVGVG